MFSRAVATCVPFREQRIGNPPYDQISATLGWTLKTEDNPWR
jgi:hypothetical protein